MLQGCFSVDNRESVELKTFWPRQIVTRSKLLQDLIADQSSIENK